MPKTKQPNNQPNKKETVNIGFLHMCFHLPKSFFALVGILFFSPDGLHL